HRRNESGDGAQRRRLSGAVRAEHRGHAALGELQVDAENDGDTLVAGAQRIHAEERHHATFSPRYARMTAGSSRTCSGDPAEMSRPKSRTWMWSQTRITSDMSWSTSNIVVPNRSRIWS